MAAPQLQTREQADYLYKQLKSGNVAPDKTEEAAEALRSFARAETAQKARQEAAGQMENLIDWSPKQGVDTSLRNKSTGPLGLGPADKARMRGDAPLGTAENPDRSYFLNQAAEAGVDVHSGLPTSDRGKVALLSFDSDVQQAALEYMAGRQLREAGIELPEGTPMVYQDETSGEAYYLRPEGGKLVRTLINPAGVDSGDMLELGPEAFSLTAEFGGAIVGGAVGSAAGGGVGTALGGAAGASGGLFASYEARIAAAKMFGIPEDLAAQTEIPFGDLAFAAGGELGGAAIMGSLRWWKNLGRPLEEKDLPRIEAKWRESGEKIKRVEDKVDGDVNLSPTIGERTGDAKLMVIEHEMRRKAVGDYASDVLAHDIDLKMNLSKSFRQLADSNGVRTPDDLAPIEEVSQQVKDRARSSVESVKQQQMEIQSQADDANDYFDAIPDMQLFRSVRDGSAASVRQAKVDSDNAWNAYRSEVGFDPVTRQSQYKLSNPGDSPIRQYMTELEGDRQGALMQSLERSQSAFLKDMGFGPAAQGAEELTGLAHKTLDMRQLHFTLSHLKRQLRQASRATDPDSYRTEDIRGMIGAIEEQIQATPIVERTGRAVSAEKQARIRLSWDNANDATRNMHEQFDTDNMKKMLETHRVKGPDGKWVDELAMSPQAVRDSLFRAGDTRFLNEALEAIGQNPTTKAALGKQLLLKYRDAVFKDGVPQQARHNDFVTAYQDHMEVLLGQEAASKINNAGDFARQLRKAEADVRRLEGNIQTAYGRRVANPLDSANIAKEMLSDRVNPTQARNIINMLDRQAPDVAEQVRGHVIHSAFAKSAGTNDILNSKVMGELIEDNAKTFDVLFGPQYRKDLMDLKDIVRMVERRSLGKAPPSQVQPWALQMLRATWGPLSRKQRIATSLNRLARHTAGKRAAELLSNPPDLRMFVRLKSMSPTDPRFLGLVGALGLAEAIDEDTMSIARDAAESRKTMAQQYGPNFGAGRVQ